MDTRFRRAAVLGAGVMGGGIAAHLAGAGLDVLLLDIVPEGEKDRSALARAAIERLRAARPAAFFHPTDAASIRVGNLEDDLAEAARCDLIIEAVREDLDIKRALFARLEPLLGPNAIVTSNTSGLPIARLMEGRTEALRRRFLVTHFFNPVRYMRLLEIIPGQDTDPDVVAAVCRFGETTLGKGIVVGRDTPNFVANRIGVHGLLVLIRLALEGGYTVEEIDAIFGPPMGRPKTAVFRTADFVGLDTVIDVARNCYANLPHDEARQVFQLPPLLEEMVRRGLRGEKSGGGFYKKTPDGILALDLRTLEYRPQQKPRFESVGRARNLTSPAERIAAVLSGSDRASDIAWKATAQSLAYASRRIGPRRDIDGNALDPPICDDLLSIDRGMRWGYGWELGPFEIWDALGVEKTVLRMEQDGIRPASWVKDMLGSGRGSFYRGDAARRLYFDVSTGGEAAVPTSPRSLSLAAVRAARGYVLTNDGATLLDLGDGVAGLEFHTKMNALDTDILEMINRALEACEQRFEALVIGNEAVEAFSAGANLMLIVMAASQSNWDLIERTVRQFQQTNLRLREAPVPVVAAPFGLTLGGGAEVAMHAAAIRAHSELYMGLVEVGVGLIPGAGGCKELLARALSRLPDEVDPFPFVRKVFETIGLAKVSTSAEEARALGFLGERDGVTFNRDHLLHDAKQTALGLARAGYRPPRRRTFRLPGPSGFATLRSWLQMMRAANQITPHDLTVGTELARVLTGGQTAPTVRVSEEHVLDLEREAFLKLCGEEKSRERMMYMLQHNKPLRN
ncbi:MAG: 3-hydroxyacyl-CoA dehydrogenase/enoyl-CoA hydratase family protein [Myxococcales bacterium]|nr:3-hydroxyacyl-CoA dehydrogenase/enoyl-CoA hydratase family protein [Myxococcota bacterium]MDW8283373.1 3-hydroxyacyl-CoA dehydrogenase/enoyl-CoA hydratase family protein [Myxococcales bacterium]